MHFWLGGNYFGASNVTEMDNQETTDRCDAVFPSRNAPEVDKSWYGRVFPPGTLFAGGFEDQNVVVLPSLNAVIVRLGQTAPLLSNFPKEKFFANITNALANAYQTLPKQPS